MSSTTNISLIAALSKERVIGVSGQLPWRLPKDLQIFKKLTVGKKILMGRKTFESIGRPLPKRENLVLTRSEVVLSGVKVFNDIDLALGQASDGNELMVIGGEQIYRQCLPKANRIYLSVVDGAFEGDAFFPKLEPDEWGIINTEHFPSDARNAHDFTLLTLSRREGTATSLPTFLFE